MIRAAEREVWTALRSLVLDRNDRKREVCLALELSFGRVKAVRHIAKGAITMRELATALGIDAPYTTVVVDDLEARGLAVRAAHPDDRRTKIVRSTAEGRRAARKANRILGTPPATMATLGDDELLELARLVARLLG